MRAALSLMLVVCLIGSGQVTAQERRTERSSGPIALAAMREAAKLDFAPQVSSDDTAWSRIRQLGPGTEIVVKLRGSKPQRRVFWSADASSVTVETPNGPKSTIARTNVVEIRGPVKTRGWIGGLVGATGGAVLGLVLGVSAVRSGREDYGALILGPVVGGVAGGFIGAHTLRYATGDVLYRAP